MTVSGVRQASSTRRVTLVVTNFHFKITAIKGLRAEWTDETLMVAGGNGTFSSEKCTLDENDVFTCVYIEPSLDDYYYGASFLVPSIYCV